jgi:type IV secretion system protein VirD4
MARNIVKTRDYSFRGVKREGISYKVKAAVVFTVSFVLTLQAAAQYIAYAFGHNPALGWRFLVKGYPVYPFYKAVHWLYVLMSAYDESRSNIAAMSAFIFSAGLIISAFAARRCYLNGKSESLESLHGTAHWATLKEIKDAGLLDENGEPFPDGVVVGGVKVGKKIKMMKHGGREHVCPYRAVLHCL